MMLCSCMCIVFYVFVFFFFKQNTAYDMRISDWSSDVCSSDLLRARTRTNEDRNQAGEYPGDRHRLWADAEQCAFADRFGALFSRWIAPAITNRMPTADKPHHAESGTDPAARPAPNHGGARLGVPAQVAAQEPDPTTKRQPHP